MGGFAIVCYSLPLKISVLVRSTVKLQDV